MKSILTLLVIMVFYLSALAQTVINWNASMNIAANTYGNMHPRMALNGTGDPMVVWGRMSDQSVFFSRWNGTAFTTPVKLNPAWLTVTGTHWMGPDIASKGDTVYVVVKRSPEVQDSNRLFIFTSFNGGLTFSAPVQLAVIADSISRFPTVTTDALGNPLVAYMKFNSSFLDSRWVVTKSTDYGNTFSTDVKASGYSGAAAEVCDCCPGAIVSSGNTTAMLYRDNLSNIRDIWTGISTNNSTSFSNGFAVDNNNWMIMSCPSSGPDGVMIGDTLYTTYMSGGSGAIRCYLSKSSVSSGMVNTVSPLTGAITGLSQQNYPRIDADGKAVAIVWTQAVSGTTRLPLLFTDDITSGTPFLYDTVDTDNITNADVAIKNGNLYVVWQDDNSGTIKYRSATYSSTTGLHGEISTSLFSIYPNPASDYWQVSSTEIHEIKKYTVTDATGKPVLSEVMNRRSASFKINISNLASGQYILAVEAKKGFQYIKVSKQ